MIRTLTDVGEPIELFGPVEAAAYLACSAYLLNKYRREGWVPPEGIFRVGVSYVYTQQALDACKRALGHEEKRIWKGVEVITDG
jgi:hypothetical protein|tara:strand:- start:188 stop:439 length:252 start_codon:yes stop_codon:yes gene_type:complete